MYAAGNDHAELFRELIFPILPRLAVRYGSSISLTFVGVHPDIDECNKYIKTYYQQGMPLDEYRRYMRENTFDIGLAPLKDTLFGRCKHYNKFVEYTIVGTPGIYSNVIPYTYVVTDEENGFLSDNDPEAWFERICTAVDNEQLRSSCLKNAVDYLRINHDPDTVRRDYKGFYCSILKDKRKECQYLAGLYKMEYLAQRLTDMTFLTVATLKKSGINGFIERTKMHITSFRK